MNNQPPPLDFADDGDLFAVPPAKSKPATRTDDHPTSIKAAARAEAAQGTIRFHVHKFAKDAGEAGFIDADLIAAFPDAPESSYRKRRSELTAEGLIVDSGRQRQNDHGNDEIVWIHREVAFQLTPPSHMKREQWDQLLRDLSAKANVVSGWSTQMIAEGRSAFGRDLNDLAHQLRLLRP